MSTEITEPANMAAALSKFQGAVGAIHKSKTAKIDSKDPNKRGFVYKYADLASIAEAAYPELAKNGLSFTASPTMGERGFVLEYALMHESGEERCGSWPLPDPRNVDIKQIGIAITYARRYCFSAVTGIVTEEDTDTQGAPAPQQEQVGRPRPQGRRQQAVPEVDTEEQERRRQKRMFALFNELEIKDRSQQIAWCEDAIGRELASRANMTAEEVEKVIESLEDEQKLLNRGVGVGPMFPEPKVNTDTGEVER